MDLTVATLALTLYFALFLGISGLAKIDRPLGERGPVGPRTGFAGLVFSQMTNRFLGVLEVVLAFFLAFGFETEAAVIVNAALFGVFLLFKVFLIVTKLGTKCGCFGAHELIVIDKSSLVASTLVLALAAILAVLAQISPASGLDWVVGAIFLAASGWLSFRTLWRRRLENAAARTMSLHSVIE